VTQGDRAAWPSDGLESVERCPACGAERRELLHEGLTDRVFGAPGRWTLHRCLACGSAFLDPRPTPETIGLAYGGDYYTHEAAAPEPTAGPRAGMINGYLNSRWGYDLAPASSVGGIAGRVLRKRGAYADRLVRHLPRPADGARLLDVGSGDGSFVARMRRLGWDAEGLDPDHEAAERARAAGVPVTTASVEDAPFPAESFDALALSHVIEHVHNPDAALQVCRRLLRPGGTLWLATPNLAGYGHAFYGRDWLGLDPPRHLVLFTRDSLVHAVERAGLAVTALPRDYSAERNFPCSAVIAAGGDSQDPAVVVNYRSRARVLAADVLSTLAPSKAEEAVVVAVRPEGERKGPSDAAT
jgi:SAM-dependent methyltransferase